MIHSGAFSCHPKGSDEWTIPVGAGNSGHTGSGSPADITTAGRNNVLAFTGKGAVHEFSGGKDTSMVFTHLMQALRFIASHAQ